MASFLDSGTHLTLACELCDAYQCRNSSVCHCRCLSGVALPCKEIPNLGHRSVPIQRSMLLTCRSYVNPATGVGPDPDELVTFRTLLMTPRKFALASDDTPRCTHSWLSHHSMLFSACGLRIKGVFTIQCVVSFDQQSLKSLAWVPVFIGHTSVALLCILPAAAGFRDSAM